MGTTQRIGNGVKNEPNWGTLTSSVTSVAKAVSELDQEDSSQQPLSKEEIEQQEKRYALLINRRDKHVRSAYEKLVNAGGGSRKISSGQSVKIGRAGLKSSGKLISFFSGASNWGLETALKKIGFQNLNGKTVREVIDYLIIFCGDSATSMDETASNKAINEVLREIESASDDTLSNLEALFKEYADGNKLSDLLCHFFGVYIFEYLSERLEERLTQMKGEAVAKETFDCIKKDIMGRVGRLNDQRPVINIEWSGQEGRDEIERIFESVIKIEEP
jgi:hypothetical protein